MTVNRAAKAAGKVVATVAAMAVAVVPEVGTVAVWAPELDAKGNSVLGAFAMERLVQLTGWGHTTL